LETHPLYPPPLVREGEIILKEGLTPLLNTFIMGFSFGKDRQKRSFTSLLKELNIIRRV